MTSDRNDPTSNKPKTIVIASSPTARSMIEGPEWQHLKLSGNTPDVIIVDEATPISEHKWPETFPDIDYAEIESRFMALYPGAVDLTNVMQGLKQATESATLSAAELGTLLHKHLEDNPELLMTKDERRHAAHPTEKNSNHPRFQNQPTRPRKRR